MKKQFFTFVMCAIMVLSIVGTVYAATATKGSYKMKYNLFATKVGTASGVGATTAEDSGKGAEVYAFVSVYSYKNSTVKNSTAKTQAAYVEAAIAGKGGNTFKSYHNLKRDDYSPIGSSLTLTK